MAEPLLEPAALPECSQRDTSRGVPPASAVTRAQSLRRVLVAVGNVQRHAAIGRFATDVCHRLARLCAACISPPTSCPGRLSLRRLPAPWDGLHGTRSGG